MVTAYKVPSTVACVLTASMSTKAQRHAAFRTVSRSRTAQVTAAVTDGAVALSTGPNDGGNDGTAVADGAPVVVPSGAAVTGATYVSNTTAAAPPAAAASRSHVAGARNANTTR